MKTIIFALLVAVMLAGLLQSPAAAAATCGDTYTVAKGDYLSKIAKACGVSLDSLIKANPEIKDINKVYPGQVIRIKAGVPLPDTTLYRVVKGDTLYKIAVRFDTTISVLLKLNPDIRSANLIYVGQTIKLPGTVTIPETGGDVSVSATSAKAGAKISVIVENFPANTAIDFRMGKSGADYSVVVDGKTNASGEATIQMTIPSSAKSGEKWVVRVLTTELIRGKEAKSPLITIVP